MSFLKGDKQILNFHSHHYYFNQINVHIDDFICLFHDVFVAVKNVCFKKSSTNKTTNEINENNDNHFIS